MARHGMGTATPRHMEQTGDDGKHTDMHRGTETPPPKTEPLSCVYTVTHSAEQTALHISACGFQAVTWRHLQPSVSWTADVHREGTFSQGIQDEDEDEDEGVQSPFVAHGNLGD